MAKLTPVPANFRLYCAERVGPVTDPSSGMRVTGRVFREAKRGASKGKLCIPIPGSVQSVVVSREEMDAARSSASATAGA
ncbi:MAG: hypothetical protein O9327_03160 [Polaromonas sp.]|nr:hypothetical protein [Polaromonas sp.]